MKIRSLLVLGLLGGAMLALPIAAPALADPVSGPQSKYVQNVDWWWDQYNGNNDAYVNHGWHEGFYEYGGHRYSCARARQLENQVWQDRRTGHPAAAHDVQEEADAARARCYSR
ncbi:MAG TPA: hypothetical protein VEJ86_07830 [Candidatus Binataceae bacterium]|nr:hypothetical protein [Candidatus Binataceae bacterium]